jgi:hypothetical protein
VNGQERPWWSSGSGPDARVEPGPAAGSDDDGHDEARAHADQPPHAHTPPLAGGDVCQVCPICTALRLVGEVRPDLVVHLAEAARHLTLAAKTIVDAHATGYGGRGLEHIPLDDDPA